MFCIQHMFQPHSLKRQLVFFLLTSAAVLIDFAAFAGILQRGSRSSWRVSGKVQLIQKAGAHDTPGGWGGIRRKIGNRTGTGTSVSSPLHASKVDRRFCQYSRCTSAIRSMLVPIILTVIHSFCCRSASQLRHFLRHGALGIGHPSFGQWGAAPTLGGPARSFLPTQQPPFVDSRVQRR